MIGKVLRSQRPAGLIRYLYGPGRREEHRDPHLVAGWRDPPELEPAIRADGRRDFRRLTGLLTQPHAALGPRGLDRPVWHCVVRAAPGDRLLSDAEWGHLARDIMDRTGLAPHGQDDEAVRWIAVRHAGDHIHIVGTLARQDGARPQFWNDYYRVREACQAAEERHGLRRTAPGDRTADRRPARAEHEKARRQGRPEASRITLLCGRGCRGAHAELMKLAEALKAPIVHAFGGKEWVEYDNPFDVGMTGLIGFSSGYEAMEDCDLLLMLGTGFPYRQFYPASATVVQVDLHAENLGRRRSLDLGLVGDVRDTIEALLPRLEAKSDRSRLDARLAHYRKAREGLDELAVGRPGHKPIHPQFVARTISEVAADDAVFTFDVGTPTIWAARYLRMNGKRRLVGSLVHGSMANAMPQAIGAQVGFPGRQVVSLSGDGGFSMLMGDFLTLLQHKLPVKIVVFNNGTLGFVELEMKAAGFLDVDVALTNPDFAAMASAAGVHATRIEDPADLREAMSEAFAHDGPALLDVVTARQELAMPPRTELSQAEGFSLWVLKAVLNGRVDEVVDLARTNLGR